MAEWHDYIIKQREEDVEAIISEEKLNPKYTRKFLENAFQDSEIKTTGTDIDKLLPSASCFGSDERTKKKQIVIDKLKEFSKSIMVMAVLQCSHQYREIKLQILYIILRS